MKFKEVGSIPVAMYPCSLPIVRLPPLNTYRERMAKSLQIRHGNSYVKCDTNVNTATNVRILGQKFFLSCRIFFIVTEENPEENLTPFKTKLRPTFSQFQSFFNRLWQKKANMFHPILCIPCTYVKKNFKLKTLLLLLLTI